MLISSQKSRTRRGLSLSEIVVATAIVGVVLTATLESIGMVYRTRRLSANRLAAPGLAQELMAEVLSMPYEDPQTPGAAIGPDSGESSATRLQFDDVDDYHGWNTSVKHRDGTLRGEYSGWTQQVQVAYADLTTPTLTAGSDLGLKRITVTVSGPQGAKTLVALRAKKGLVDQPQGLDADAVTWIGAALQVGVGARSERWGTCISNPAQDAN